MFKQLLAIACNLLIGAVLSYFAGSNSLLVHGYPLFWWMTAFNYAINILAFIHGAIFNTQRYYIPVSTSTYIVIAWLAIYLNDLSVTRQYIAAVTITLYAIRLGSFLFMRMQKSADSRLTELKTDLLSFLNLWLLQAVWVLIAYSPVIVLMTVHSKRISTGPLNVIELTGIAIWVIGMVIETVSDEQKLAFRENKANKDKFITSGLWKYSRHINYVGQSLIWLGMTMFAYPSLLGMELITLISPVFITYMLRYVTGANILEQKADKKWGDDPTYREYKRRTPVYFPIGSGDEVTIKKQ